MMTVAANIAQVRQRIDEAARRSGRDPQTITLMAVTKTVPVEPIRAAYDAGVRVFGENRVQEFAKKAPSLKPLLATWHMIGHLQSNKARAAAELFNSVDSVDSPGLLQKLNTYGQEHGRRISALIEINIGGEDTKSGVAADSSELKDILRTAASCESVQVSGLMTVPPYRSDPEASRVYFRKMRQLFESIAQRRLPGIRMDELSMGMSHDFEVAIEEGSTCIRVGTAIFGERPPVRSQM